ncbi:hypothetical protein GCM10028778_04690 [Barrientosiimonas marina]|uniref:Hydrolase n=1 Tax=Lentibacillus kimchii TaxID=1542911 RepID=A0ABW2UQJ7_9BACI
MKKKFYFNMGSQEISQVRYANNDTYVIYATEDEANQLRQQLDGMNTADMNAFYRSHVPIKSYHHDKPNDDYDAGITDAFQMIYDLGDNETKQHIENMGILSDYRM